MKIDELRNERRWYHGTTRAKWEKIKQSRFIKPFEADNHENAVHFTLDKETAKEYSGRTGRVVSISHRDMMNFKHKIYSSMPRGMRKEYGLTYKEVPYSADLMVYEKIPTKYLRLEA